ncbi:Putative spermidine/spermine synthase, S-adenosyl-L-methionine-dependent methyltransferase [Septoria linicola]|uniref:Spermidine/spermine synthase, S-adenosyl-L-methionine-dependent methyltransferase n=1 Tax=Septoria linicola TaxID=215465 RepID=A0A9Q9EF29_9PEZI|nr:Putative spermidine/spermine synthase, S-adenosyl-L-methionine-dependent methyltransferase [Septoria linicola]
MVEGLEHPLVKGIDHGHVPTTQSTPLTIQTDGWFRESTDLWDESLGIRCNGVPHVEKSRYQDILVFNAPSLGNVLVVDGIVQCSERDERAYSEVLANVPMNAHPNPRKVLIIDGGDGGVLRDVLTHDCLEQAVLVDIDEAVIRLSKEYLPFKAVGLSHPRPESSWETDSNT